MHARLATPIVLFTTALALGACQQLSNLAGRGTVAGTANRYGRPVGRRDRDDAADGRGHVAGDRRADRPRCAAHRDALRRAGAQPADAGGRGAPRARGARPVHRAAARAAGARHLDPDRGGPDPGARLRAGGARLGAGAAHRLLARRRLGDRRPRHLRRLGPRPPGGNRRGGAVRALPPGAGAQIPGGARGRGRRLSLGGVERAQPRRRSEPRGRGRRERRRQPRDQRGDRRARHAPADAATHGADLPGRRHRHQHALLQREHRDRAALPRRHALVRGQGDAEPGRPPGSAPRSGRQGAAGRPAASDHRQRGTRSPALRGRSAGPPVAGSRVSRSSAATTRASRTSSSAWRRPWRMRKPRRTSSAIAFAPRWAAGAASRPAEVGVAGRQCSGTRRPAAAHCRRAPRWPHWRQQRPAR